MYGRDQGSSLLVVVLGSTLLLLLLLQLPTTTTATATGGGSPLDRVTVESLANQAHLDVRARLELFQHHRRARTQQQQQPLGIDVEQRASRAIPAVLPPPVKQGGEGGLAYYYETPAPPPPCPSGPNRDDVHLAGFIISLVFLAITAAALAFFLISFVVDRCRMMVLRLLKRNSS